MFNVTGGELVIIFIVALVVLGPERLPEAARTAGRIMAQIREVSSGFQKELKSAMNEVGEPLQQLTRPQLTAIDGGAKPDATDKPKSAEMATLITPSPAVDPEPVAGWSTPPRPSIPDGPPPAEPTATGPAATATPPGPGPAAQAQTMLDAAGAAPPLQPTPPSAPTTSPTPGQPEAQPPPAGGDRADS